MQYGYFDEERKEYVITKPDTPEPWANYLGSPEYGAIISNNAGGYSFVKSGANGRILRYVFNSFDQPGRYIYLRDNETGDYWSNSWMPVPLSPMTVTLKLLIFTLTVAPFTMPSSSIRLVRYRSSSGHVIPTTRTVSNTGRLMVPSLFTT